jgi:hypothetical protein
MIAIVIVLTYFVTTSQSSPISSGDGKVGAAQKIQMNIGDLWYVSSLKEVCLQVNLTVPPGTVSVFHGSSIKLAKESDKNREIHSLNQNKCVWYQEEKLNPVGGETSFIACSDGFGKELKPSDEISFFGRLKVRVECPRFLTQCRNVGEPMEGSHIEENIFELDMKTIKIRKVIHHDEQITNMCTMGVIRHPCHPCAVSCATLLFGGNHVRCNGWWNALSVSTTSKVRFLDVKEDCSCANKF